MIIFIGRWNKIFHRAVVLDPILWSNTPSVYRVSQYMKHRNLVQSKISESSCTGLFTSAPYMAIHEPRCLQVVRVYDARTNFVSRSVIFFCCCVRPSFASSPKCVEELLAKESQCPVCKKLLKTKTAQRQFVNNKVRERGHDIAYEEQRAHAFNFLLELRLLQTRTESYRVPSSRATV